MARELRFWRNVILIGLAHVALLVGLARWGGAKKPPKTEVVWMATAAGLPNEAPAEPPPPAEPEPAADFEPEPTPPPPPPEEPPKPAMTPVESEMALPSATPSPTPRPTPSATPKASAKPKQSPTPKAKKTKRTKSTPEPTPKKAKKKTSPAPKSTPAAKSSPKEKKTAKVAVDPIKKEGGAGGSSAAGGAAVDPAQFNWYGNMLHDRFFGAWAQPTAASAAGGRMAALVELRIERDGRVSDFRIVRSSGNVVVDESVVAVGKRVTKVDPLPAGLASEGHYDVRIKFELDVE